MVKKQIDEDGFSKTANNICIHGVDGLTLNERFFQCLSRQGLTAKGYSEFIGVTGTSLVYNWKNRNQDATVRYIPSMCEYLHVSPTYLLTGIKEPGWDKWSIEQCSRSANVEPKGYTRLISRAEENPK